MSPSGQTLQGVCGRAALEVRFGSKTDMIPPGLGVERERQFSCRCLSFW